MLSSWAYTQPLLTKRCHNSCWHTLSNFYTSAISSFISVLQMRKPRVRKLILTFSKFMQLFSGTGRMKTQNCLSPITCLITHPHLYISSGYRSGNGLCCSLYHTALLLGRYYWASQVAQWWRICLPMQEIQETWVRSLDWEDPLEKEMATHFSILAWKILWIEELSRLQSMGRKESDTTERVCTHTHTHTHTHTCRHACTWVLLSLFEIHN